MKNDLYAGSGSSSSGSSSSAASSSSMQTALLPGGAAGNSLSALSGGGGGKGSLAIGKSIFYTERPPNEYASSLGKFSLTDKFNKISYENTYTYLYKYMKIYLCCIPLGHTAGAMHRLSWLGAGFVLLFAAL